MKSFVIQWCLCIAWLLSKNFVFFPSCEIHWKYGLRTHKATSAFLFDFMDYHPNNLMQIIRSCLNKLFAIHLLKECTKCEEWTDTIKTISSTLSSSFKIKLLKDCGRTRQRIRPRFLVGSKEFVLRSALDKKKQGVLGTIQSNSSWLIFLIKKTIFFIQNICQKIANDTFKMRYKIYITWLLMKKLSPY